MLGTIRVEVPDGCQNCDFFQLILNNPLIVNHGMTTEDMKGACHCMLDKTGRRLKPLDNGEVLIEKPTKVTKVEYDEEYDELYEVNSVHYETETYKGRPEWCAIKTGERV